MCVCVALEQQCIGVAQIACTTLDPLPLISDKSLRNAGLWFIVQEEQPLCLAGAGVVTASPFFWDVSS